MSWEYKMSLQARAEALGREAEKAWKDKNKDTSVTDWENFKKQFNQSVADREEKNPSGIQETEEYLSEIGARFDKYYIKSFDLHFLMIQGIDVTIKESEPDEYSWRGTTFSGCEEWRIHPNLRENLEKKRRRGWTIGPRKEKGRWKLVVKNKGGEDSPWPLLDDYNWEPLPGKSEEGVEESPEGSDMRTQEDESDESSEGSDMRAQEDESDESSKEPEQDSKEGGKKRKRYEESCSESEAD
jgi:hypothetical protein